MTKQQDAKKILRTGVLVLLAIVVVGYSIFQARKILEGPELRITSPTEAMVSGNPLVEVMGVAKNIKDISLNDQPIYIDEQGNFKEKLLLLEGYNIIKLKAEDKFGKKTERQMEVVYN